MSDTCACLDVADALRLHFAQQPMPPCPVHDVPLDLDTTTPIALNDDNSLKAIIGAALGAPLTTTQEIQ
ncbi:MAG: hypothetical protein JWR85_3815 [Marmoricola sp.]|nr:hypothetical protein [Marmoricola sp.]